MAYEAKTVATWILSKADQKKISVSPLKLQKLLYYFQGYFIGMAGEKLFDDPIEAWQHGPVVESVYQEYKEYGNNVITTPEAVVIPQDLDNFVSFVLDEKGQYTASKLRNMTHDEAPYKETYTNDEITFENLRNYFTPQFWASDEEDDFEPSFDSLEEEKKYFSKTLSDEEKRNILDISISIDEEKRKILENACL